MPMEEKLISKKKPFYPIIDELKKYLQHHSRWVYTPVYYDDLLRFSGSVVVFDANDQDTLWVRVYYSDSERVEIDFNLKKVYALLHSDGNESSMPFLNIDAIDLFVTIIQDVYKNFDRLESKQHKIEFGIHINSIIDSLLIKIGDNT